MLRAPNIIEAPEYFGQPRTLLGGGHPCATHPALQLEQLVFFRTLNKMTTKVKTEASAHCSGGRLEKPMLNTQPAYWRGLIVRAPPASKTAWPRPGLPHIGKNGNPGQWVGCWGVGARRFGG